METIMTPSLQPAFCVSIHFVARPIVSVVISARNEARHVQACLESLIQQKTRIPFELHFIDNGSTDATYRIAKKIAQTQKNFHVWRHSKPGASSARNYGAKRARGRILLFADANCRLDPHWVEEMAKPLLKPSHYPLAAVGGRTVSEFRGAKPNLWENYLDRLFALWEKDRLGAFPAFLPWVPACCLAVRRDIFLALGGFDPNWKNAAYDVDFCWRLVLCGFMLGHAPKAEVRHLRRHTLRGLLRQLESFAFYNRSLHATYQNLLQLPAIELSTERTLTRGRHVLRLAAKSHPLRQLAFRAIDFTFIAATAQSRLLARVLGPKADANLNPSRLGLTPEELIDQLPAGYSFLHREGWVYWKDTPAVNEEGDLILFRPRRGERYRLNESAWKVWEIKAGRGQSEDAAQALGESIKDEQVLRDIDELTMDLRTQRLLPY
jgi:glycosyltransferase involved in cell wall biosynthesis